MCVCVLGNDFMALTSSKSVRIAISKVLIEITQLSSMSFVYLPKWHPRQGFFACLLMAPEGLGSESRWK